MKNYNVILTVEKQKWSLLSLAKVDKYEYLTDEEILSSDQSRMKEKAKFT